METAAHAGAGRGRAREARRVPAGGELWVVNYGLRARVFRPDGRRRNQKASAAVTDVTRAPMIANDPRFNTRILNRRERPGPFAPAGPAGKYSPAGRGTGLPC